MLDYIVQGKILFLSAKLVLTTCFFTVSATNLGMFDWSSLSCRACGRHFERECFVEDKLLLDSVCCSKYIWNSTTTRLQTMKCTKTVDFTSISIWSSHAVCQTLWSHTKQGISLTRTLKIKKERNKRPVCYIFVRFVPVSSVLRDVNCEGGSPRIKHHNYSSYTDI